nr:immunoglobulin light chain junction region [Macaca mulatta]MOX34922.1 immunoglobulin light chain junction region [Macaca mulatta]MOX36870.1 immunoglobulin light chain junction region [Macaca mulatta]MOX37157.1 immunoglobulin light chain junction region [Macaca mulatta]MOX41907.1 immunoglobulin light chain junction region [Macaca mulatta]
DYYCCSYTTGSTWVF